MKENELAPYRNLLGEIKSRVRQAQHRAAMSANAEMILMYWDIGRLIAARQELEGWGTRVIPRLAADLKNELPEEKGFSERNIGRMIALYRAYPIVPQPVAQLQTKERKGLTVRTQPVEESRASAPSGRSARSRLIQPSVTLSGRPERPGDRSNALRRARPWHALRSGQTNGVLQQWICGRTSYFADPPCRSRRIYNCG